MNQKTINVLLSPLNWGLGHASRSIPLIRFLRERNASVLLGGDGLSLALLKDEFADIQTVGLPNYKIEYNNSWGINTQLAMSFRSMNNHLKKEHTLTQEIVTDHDIDLIISDNRYGVCSRNAFSVIITHQTNLPSHPLKYPAQKILERKLREFDQVWVPDFKSPKSLAGSLSKVGSRITNAFHIGPLSRFDSRERNMSEADNGWLAILSGPEPHRSRFEKEVLAQLAEIDGEHVVIRGTKEKRMNAPTNVKLIDLANSISVFDLINSKKYLLSRSGYSSIMDYAALEKKALIVHTPGQAEQKLLAKYHKEKNWHLVQSENQLNLKLAQKKWAGLNDQPKFRSEYKSYISDLLDSIP